MTAEGEELKIPISEMFYSIQGEGPYAGTPAIFLRCGGCNLLCGDPANPEAPQEEMEKSGDAEWLCDTIEVWRNADSYSISELAQEFKSRGWWELLEDGKVHLILTGGEPLLEARQRQLAAFLDALDFQIFVEVETNGTQTTIEEFDKHVNQYNVSLKLSNSGMSMERRVVDEAIEDFAGDNHSGGLNRVTWKPVVHSMEDLAEWRDIESEFGIRTEDVMLMPAGSSKEELAETYPRVAEMVKEYGYEFSPRLHIGIWDVATGV